MPEHCIPYRDTGYFSDLIVDYLAKDKQIEFLYNRFPELDSFGKQIEEKFLNFTPENRKILVKILKKQYQNCEISPKTGKHINALSEKNTFTVTTGHQLNLFTGPLYFLYKIVSTINLCKQLKEKYPDKNFVPIYWMATEDHDFEEINYFNFQGKKVVWERESQGAVGQFSTEGLQEVFTTFSKTLGNSPNAIQLQTLFKNAYLEHNNLANATRHLANALFGAYGLVILDGDEKELKQLFIPYIKAELFKNTSSEVVAKTNLEINSISDKNYKIQVNPREINLFYLKEEIRERIIVKDGIFYINNSNLKFTKDELQTEIENHPEYFSPNVILRPLYQEVILPNLCYIGGGGELAYWLQLKAFFEEVKVTFPVLLLRNSAVLITKKQLEKIKKLGLSVEDLFLPTYELETKVTKKISEIKIDFSPQRKHLQQQFKDLYQIAKQTDPSFKGAVAAQEKKQLNGLDALEKRLLKAQKRKLIDHLNRVLVLQDELFPNGSLQERTGNFSEWYLEYGDILLETLFKQLKPLQHQFICVKF